MRLPTGSSFGNSRDAIVSLITVVLGVFRRSSRVNVRPIASGIPNSRLVTIPDSGSVRDDMLQLMREYLRVTLGMTGEPILPRIAAAAEEYARAIHPDAFK